MSGRTIRGPYPDDDRWEWIDVRQFGDPDSVWIKGRCRHTEIIPVENILTGEIIAKLCRTCDQAWEVE